MALRLLEPKKDKIAAQTDFAKYMQVAWKEAERRRVVWRPDSREMDVVHNQEFWFVSVAPGRNHNSTRYWNSIGAYHESGNLQIAVEINIPIESNERTIAGFFAQDESTGTVYLMHDGGVGGGRKGVGKEAFLAWSGEKLVQVFDSQGRVRLGILVAPLKPRLIGNHIASFAKKVLAFKNAVKTGEMPDDALTDENRRSYGDYFREFSGKKRGQRAKEFEYVSRHGDIVDALRQWRVNRAIDGERISKNAYIDLGVVLSDELTEIYEVKTSTDRQALYTAIGQILVHDIAGVEDVLRYLVVPNDGSLPHDITRALKRFHIKILRFELTDSTVNILD